MDYFRSIVEERIQNAQREGVFDNLPGKGKPLNFEDDSSVPEDLRLAFKVLKNSNCLPIFTETGPKLLKKIVVADTSAIDNLLGVPL